jgi:transcriptional regulator with XRE-family HTH domain
MPSAPSATSRRLTLGPATRATQEVIRGRGRADAVAARLGVGLKDARIAAAMTQAEAAARARISQARWSELERGLGANAPIELWAVVAAAVGVQLAAFLEAVSGANLPRDMEHLRRQSALVDRAAPGGWSAAPEMPVTRGGSAA